jgi:II/X family phage/plasmid replication protein
MLVKNDAFDVRPSFMVDWLTCELPDPVGIPVNAGELIRIDRDGQVEWSAPARLQVEGSHSSSMTFRAIGLPPDLRGIGQSVVDSSLVVSGNPAKFLNGHNLFGSDDVAGLLDATVRKAKDAIWPDLFELPELDLAEAKISRIDLTASWVLDRAEDVMPYLRAMEETIWCPYRGRGVFDIGGSTLYYGRTDKGKRAKDWAIKLYWKGAEVSAHPLPEAAYVISELFEELNRTIRVELTLRTSELKRLGLTTIGRWSPARVREIWEAYVAKLDFGEATINLDAVDVGQLDLKPRHALALAAWKAGNDMRACMQPRSFQRLRKELKVLTGFDIANPRPKSNIVPLQRAVVATAAGLPRWADKLTQVLHRAA